MRMYGPCMCKFFLMYYLWDLYTGRPRIVDNSLLTLTVKDYHKLTEDILTSNSRIHRTVNFESKKNQNQKSNEPKRNDYTYQTLTRLALIYPLLSTLKYYIFQFLMLARL